MIFETRLICNSSLEHEAIESDSESSSSEAELESENTVETVFEAAASTSTWLYLYLYCDHFFSEHLTSLFLNKYITGIYQNYQKWDEIF